MTAKGKPPWKSKTLWVNLIAILGLFTQWLFGWDLSYEVQALILSTLNIFLRLGTSQPLAVANQSANNTTENPNDPANDHRNFDQALADRDGPAITAAFDRLHDNRENGPRGEN